MKTPHTVVETDGLPPARGFSHALSAAPGRTVWVAGEIAMNAAGEVIGVTWADQFAAALDNVVMALAAAGAAPQHVVWMQIFTTDMEAYRAATPELGPIYRERMGNHFPAMALVGVTELVEASALVEITVTAVIPDAT